MENKAIFNDTTDVKEAYKSLQNIAKLSEGTENEGITKRECKRVEEFIDYIMKRLETSETDRFGLMSLV